MRIFCSVKDSHIFFNKKYLCICIIKFKILTKLTTLLIWNNWSLIFAYMQKQRRRSVPLFSLQSPLIYFLKQNFEPLMIFCGCTAMFVLDLVGNQEDMFSHDAAEILSAI